MFDIKTLGYLRNLVNEQLRRQDCECLSEEKLHNLKYQLSNAINAACMCKFIKHIEDALPGDDLDLEELDKAMDVFHSKKFTIGFDGMSVNLPAGPEIYDGTLQLMRDYYDEYYACNGKTYELREKLNNVKFHIGYIDANGSDPVHLDNVVRAQYANHDIMREIIDDLIALL